MRIPNQWSRPIYDWIWPIRYFQKACVLGGFKTPAILFSLQVQLGTTIAWHGVSGWFESSAFFFNFITLMSILFYIICFLSYIQSALVDQLVKALAGKHWDLGSNPRSPHITSIILFDLFPCSFHPNDHHTSNASACHVSPMIHPVARNQESMEYSSQRVGMWSKKSASGLIQMGLIHQITSKKG